MNIRYLGHSSFLIKSKEASVVIDPFKPDSVGFPFPKISADIVLVSHDHDDHNNVAAVGGDPFVINGPGEYEVSGVKVWAFPAFHDAKEGAEKGRNTVYLIEAEGLTLCHLGDLGHLLEEKTAEEIGSPDILLIPTGGVYTINHEEAAKVVAQLEPWIVIPMHYKVAGMKDTFKDLSEVGAFLEEMGSGEVEPQKELKVAAGKFPEETKVVVLEHQ